MSDKRGIGGRHTNSDIISSPGSRLASGLHPNYVIELIGANYYAVPITDTLAAYGPDTLTNVLQNATTALAAAGGAIWINCSGTVSTVTVRSGLTYYGNGTGTTLTLQGNAQAPAFNMFIIGNYNDVIFQNIKFDGNKANVVPTGGAVDGNIIYGAGSGLRLKVLGCYFLNVDQHAIVHAVGSTSREWLVNHCIFEGGTWWDVAFAGGDYNSLVNCALYGSYGFELASDHNTAVGNVVYNATNKAFIVNGDDNTVAGNAIYTTPVGISLEGVRNVASGNQLYGGANATNGIQLVTGSRNSVSGNTIYDFDYGIGVYNGLNSISGNTCIACDSHGIRLYGASNNVVTGNMFEGSGQYGIMVDAVSLENLIHGNYTQASVTACARINNVNCLRNTFVHNCFDEGAISDVGGAHGCIAYLNYDPSAGAMIATINAPLVVGGGGGALP